MSKWEFGKRIDPKVFDLPVTKIKSGWYSDKYFVRTKEVLVRDDHHPHVLMQVWSQKSGVVCGIDEAVAVLKLCSDPAGVIKIRALFDGTPIEEGETVMTIEGDYAAFAHLETVYLGCIARRSAVATAVKRVVAAAQDKQILFFPARFDHYSVQTGDGYAAFISGALGVSTDANASWWGEEGIGTVPHGLIAAYGGDTVKACVAFEKLMPKDVKLVALVDFENDCVGTSVQCAGALGRRLWGVRLDTSINIRDKSVVPRDEYSLGVCPELVCNVRSALDAIGATDVKIVVSGGFNEKRIHQFMQLGVPFDAVGIGSSLFHEKMDFTADIVLLEGKPCAKAGRKYNPNPKLQDVV